MPKFFIPTSWENLADAMRFRSKVSLGPNNGDPNSVNAKKAKLKKKKDKKSIQGSPTAAASSKTGGLVKAKDRKNQSKVLNGGILKPNSRKNRKSQTKMILAPVPPLALPVAATSATKMKSNKKLTKKASKQVASVIKSQGAGDGPVAQNSTSKTAILQESQDEEAMHVDEELTPTNSEDDGLKVFENSLKQQLLAGRFRYINEQLYTIDSAEAEELFKTDADAFEAYHSGYQQQVAKWPMNPLDRIIKMIKRLPKTLEIADFGCGEGRLAKSVPNKVYSMDLVSTRDDIIACDMAKTPLADQTVDIAVYCLSLMGTNLKDYLLEANRVLKISGLVVIAEIQSRFDDLRNFTLGLQACGFELVKKDINEHLFYFFQFKKVRNVGKVAVIPPFSLKPCLYRKR